MEITGKTLLNQAESILKDRRQDSRGAGGVRGSDGSIGRTSGRSDVSQTSMESRLLNLQSSLNQIQHDYSREQTRHTYLNNYPDRITSELRFGEEPLFPELLKDKADPSELQRKVSHNMDQLMRALKGVQVEMENLYALNFDAPPTPIKDAATLLSNKGIKELDPSRVARLTDSQ